MDDGFIVNLSNLITAKRFVNLYSRECTDTGGEVIVEEILPMLREEQGRDYFFDVNLKRFTGRENDDEQVSILKDIFKEELSKKGTKKRLAPAISIADALSKWSEIFQRPGLAVFHSFRKKNDEMEKDILRSLRLFLGFEQKSALLMILLISSQRLDRWELFPESNIDERQVTFHEHI